MKSPFLCKRGSAVPLVAAALSVLLGSLVGPGPVAAQSVSAEAEYAAWVERLENRYEAQPELKDQPGSGWKPFNRIKWFTEQRMLNGELPPPGARYRVWEERVERERQYASLARASWFSLGPFNFAGRILTLKFDPTDSNILYAGSASGGLWKSTNGGVDWIPLSDENPTLAVGGLAILPSDPNVILIGTGEGTNNVDRVGGVGILKSTDGGLTWGQTSLTYDESSGHGFHVMSVNSSTSTILAGATDGLYRSTDEGDTWTAVKSGGDWYDVKRKPGVPSQVYTVKGSDASGNGVKVSTDDGVTWSFAGTGQPASYQIGKSKLAVTADDPAYVYAVYVNRATSGLLGVYKSTDEGANWTAGATSPNITGAQGWYNLSLAADPNDAEKIITGGVSLYRSLNGGSSLSLIGSNVHVDHHAIVYEPGDDNTVFVGTDGGVWESNSDGGSWTDRNAGLVTYQFYDICVNNHSDDPNLILGGTQDNGTDRWTGSTTWGNGLGADGMVCNINPNNGTTVYAEIQFGVHYKNYTSGAGSWSSINSGITGDGNWVTPVDEDQASGNHLYTSTNHGIFKTENGGSTWENVAAHTAVWISISPLDGDVVWTVAGAPKYTTNDGFTWNDASAYGFSTGGALKILAHPTNLNAALVTFSGYSDLVAHVAYTTDMGSTWQDVTGDLPGQPVNAVAVDPLSPDMWYIGTDVGVWASTNNGVNWIPYEVGLPNVVISDLEIQHTTRKLFAGTHGRGAWEVNILPPLSTGVAVTQPTSPLNLMLDPPYPNPVAGETTLRYAARHGGEVTLSVYDVQGRLVNEAARHARGDGIVRWVKWYSDDAPSGVYFAVLQAGEDRISRKLVVTK